jgi:hypothetical protein
MALTTKHLFPFLRLMKALDIKNELKLIVRKNKEDLGELTEEEREALTQEKGIDLVFALLEKMPNAEKEIKSFLALYTDRTVEDIEALPVEEFIALIKQFFKEPVLKSFLQQAAK